MRLPFSTGGSPVGGSPSVVRQMLDALRELQGSGGYSEDPDSLRDRELSALAIAPGVAVQSLWRASAQGFPQLATDELSAWERAYSLREDAARDPSERQARVVAAERAIGGAQPARMDASLRTVAPGAVVTSPTAAEVTAHEATDGHIATPFVMVTEAEHASRVSRTTATELLRRQLPARAWGQDGRTLVDDCLGVYEGVEWGSANHVLGRDALGRDGSAASPMINPPVRHRDYGPLSKVRADDLNAIQEGVLASPCDGGTDLFETASHGQSVRPFSGVVTGTPLTLTGVDWRDRWVLFSWAASSTDIRPGGAAWPEDQAGGLYVGTEFVYTGLGGSGSYMTEFYAGNLRFEVDASTGVPSIVRIPGSGTMYVTGYFIVTQDLDRR